MTVDEFLAWDPADPSAPLWQLIDGEPVAMAPGSENHGALQGEIGRLIVTPGIVPRIHANRNFRIPDLGVTCASPSGAQFVPEPVLLVEILSPSNESETWGNVWAYATIPSVTEILAVRSTRIEAELLRRQPDGNWPAESALLTAGAIVELTSVGMAVPLAALYATTTLGAAASAG